MDENHILRDEPAEAAGTGSAAPPQRRSRRRLALLVVASALVVVVLALAGLVAALRQEAGTRWLLGHVPGLEVSGSSGSLLGDRFAAKRIVWRGGGANGAVLAIDDLLLEGLGVRWRPRPGAWAAIDAAHASASRVAWTSAKEAQKTDAPPKPPHDLGLPIDVAVARLDAAEVRIDALPPLAAVSARVAIGAGGGLAHRVEALSLDWQRVHLEGDASIGTAPPFGVKAALRAHSREGTPWSAEATAEGPLEALPFTVRLQGEAGAERPAPSLQASGTLAPFHAWPLGTLDLAMRDIDAAAFAATAPFTRLAGTAVVRTAGIDQPATAEIALSNAIAGRWNEARLPVRAIALSLGGRLDRRDRVDIENFDLQLGSEREPAGRWQGRGEWAGTTLRFESRIESLRPERLDGRAPALVADGPVNVSVDGLPPAGATGASAAPSSAPASSAARAAGSASASGAGWTATLDARLSGRLAARPTQPLGLILRGSATASEAKVAELRLSDGDAHAELNARVRFGGPALAIESRGEWAGIDLRPWWPNLAASGTERLDGRFDAALSLPESALKGGAAPVALARALRGKAEVALAESQWAGVPVSGSLHFDAPAGSGAQLSASLDAAGNTVQLDGRLGPAADGSADTLKLEIRADELAALAPIGPSFSPGVGAWMPKGGRAHIVAEATGAWPRLRTEGQAELAELRIADLSLAGGSARWQLSAGDDAPFAGELTLADLRRGTTRLDRAHAVLSGTRASHRLEVDAESPVRPPLWTDALLGAPGTGSVLKAILEGSLRSATGKPSEATTAPAPTASVGLAAFSWRGTLTTLRGGARESPQTTPWLAAQPFGFELRFDASGAPIYAAATPGRVDLAVGAITWSEARWQRGGTAPSQLALKARIEPIAVAPLLAKLQPDFGWGGDLVLGGRIDVKTGDRGLEADAAIERAGGDLQLSDALGNRQNLGLSELRVSLAAHGGEWRFEQRVAGSNLGDVTGVQTVRTAPDRLWPAPDAAVAGMLDAKVANLGAWASWMPPGWRLAGAVETEAKIAGRFEAPELSGVVTGSGIGIRNVLQGVALTDGDLRIALAGRKATIEAFRMKAGDGTLALTGGATLGDKPEARIHFEAERFQAIGRVDRRIVVSGGADLLLKTDSMKLDGRLAVDEGLVDFTHADAPSLDADVIVVRENAGPPPAPPEPPAWLRESVVALNVDLGKKLRLRGRGIDTTLVGELRISTPGGAPSITGTVRTEGGRYLAYGQKLDIVRGEVAFSGSPANPRLDIRAVRSDLDITVGVAVSGTAQNPRVRLFSEPEMSDYDKLSWLVLGRAPDALGRSDSALLQRAAMALLSGENSSSDNSLLNRVGLTDFSIGQSDEGEVHDTVVSLGRQISKHWYVGYARGVNATAGTWQLIYRVARSFTVRAQSGEDQSLDAIWTWRW